MILITCLTLLQAFGLAISAQVIRTELEQGQGFSTLLRGISNGISNAECKRQMHTFLRALDDANLWAVQMLDASAKIPIGLITASTYQLGDFDECIGVNADNLLGKYCLADVSFAPTFDNYPAFYRSHIPNAFSLHYDPYTSVWEKFIVTADPSKRRRTLYHHGICIPHGCSATDAEVMLRGLATAPAQHYGLHVNISVSETSCATAQPKPMLTGGRVLSGVLWFLVAGVLLSTLWDLVRSRDNAELSQGGKLVESLSIYRNMVKLSTPEPSTEMAAFHGMKSLTMVLNMLGHRCASSYGGPFFNPEFLEERYRKFQDMFLLNGSLIVDTFFMIAGYMTFVGLFREYSAGRKIRASQVYMHRWMRITPVYMLVVFFYGYLLEHLGSGPVWNLRVGREAERCRDNWWTNFLYINNYVNSDRLCMFQSWYITCDMHFILLAPIFAKACAKSPKKGLLLLLTLLLVSILVPFTLTYVNHYDGVLRVYMTIFEDLANSFTFSRVYIRTHNRAIPYVVGMLAGYLYLKIQKSGFILSKTQTWIGIVASTSLSMGAICGAWMFYIPGREYDPLENATYAAFHRVLWAASMAWIPIGCAQNAFGIIQPIVTSKAYVPFSRLCFGAFLVHGAVQMYTTMTLRTPEWMAFPKIFWMASGDVLISFFFAFLIYIFVEAPVGVLIKVILMPTRKQSGKNKFESQSNGVVEDAEKKSQQENGGTQVQLNGTKGDKEN